MHGPASASPAPWLLEELMADSATELTMEELRARIQAAGIEIAEARLKMVRRLVGEALAPIRAMDARPGKALEPAVTFNAGNPEGSGHDVR
jgi:hypothetical protein